MSSQRLQKMLEVITEQFDAHKIPFAIIGAIAMGLYGIPRYTADLDLIADRDDQADVTRILEKLDFRCCYRTGAFARFDSELGVYGQVDCMFVQTRDGRDMLGRRVRVNDPVMGAVPVR